MAQFDYSLIVARGHGNAIGRGNDMPWHVPADFRYFKAQTTGKPIIMGRKTFQSILDRLGKPLPNRHSIVISRSGFAHDGVPVCHDFEAAAHTAKQWAQANNAHEVMIGGGAEIYKLALPYLHKAYITEIPVDVPDADAFFPALPASWKQVTSENGEGCTFTVWENSAPKPLV